MPFGGPEGFHWPANTSPELEHWFAQIKGAFDQVDERFNNQTTETGVVVVDPPLSGVVPELAYFDTTSSIAPAIGFSYETGPDIEGYTNFLQISSDIGVDPALDNTLYIGGCTHPFLTMYSTNFQASPDGVGDINNVQFSWCTDINTGLYKASNGHIGLVSDADWMLWLREDGTWDGGGFGTSDMKFQADTANLGNASVLIRHWNRATDSIGSVTIAPTGTQDYSELRLYNGSPELLPPAVGSLKISVDGPTATIEGESVGTALTPVTGLNIDIATTFNADFLWGTDSTHSVGSTTERALHIWTDGITVTDGVKASSIDYATPNGGLGANGSDQLIFDIGSYTGTAPTFVGTDEFVVYDVSATGTAQTHWGVAFQDFDVTLFDTSGLSSAGYNTAGVGLVEVSATEVAADYDSANNIITDANTGTAVTLTTADQFLVHDTSATGTYVKKMTLGDLTDVLAAASHTHPASEITAGTFASTGTGQYLINGDLELYSNSSGQLLRLHDTAAAASTFADPHMVFEYSNGGAVTTLGYIGYLSGADTLLSIDNRAGNIELTDGTDDVQIVSGNIIRPSGNGTTINVQYGFQNSNNSGMYWNGTDLVVQKGSGADWTFGTSSLTASDQILATGGSGGAGGSPGYSFAGDADMGMYRAGTDTIGLNARIVRVTQPVSINGMFYLDVLSATGDPYMAWRCNNGGTELMRAGSTDSHVGYHDVRSTTGEYELRFNGTTKFSMVNIDGDEARAGYIGCQFYVYEEQTTYNAASVTLDWDQSNQLVIDNDGTTATVEISPGIMQLGGVYTVIVVYETGTTTSFTWTSTGSALIWEGGTAPTFGNASAGDCTEVTFRKTSANIFYERILGSWRDYT